MIVPKCYRLMVHVKFTDGNGKIYCIYDHEVNESSIVKCFAISSFSSILQHNWGRVYIGERVAWFTKCFSCGKYDSINFDLIPVYG